MLDTSLSVTPTPNPTPAVLYIFGLHYTAALVNFYFPTSIKSLETGERQVTWNLTSEQDSLYI